MLALGSRLERGAEQKVTPAHKLQLTADARALLLSDARDVERLLVFEPEKAILLTTWDYLRQREEAQRIRSADAVMQAVRATGRDPPQRDLWSDHDPAIRDAVRAVIERAHQDKAWNSGPSNLPIGYARVSAADQNPDLQRNAPTEAGCEQIVTERMSGAVADGPEPMAAPGWTRGRIR
jgi:hypothetical protein